MLPPPSPSLLPEAGQEKQIPSQKPPRAKLGPCCAAMKPLLGTRSPTFPLQILPYLIVSPRGNTGDS